MLYPQGVWRVLGLLLIVPLWILACGTDATATPEPATPSPGQIIVRWEDIRQVFRG